MDQVNLLSFRILDDLTRNDRHHQCFLISKRCSYLICSAPSAKKRKLDSDELKSFNLESSSLPILGAGLQNEEIQPKHGCIVKSPSEANTRFNVMRIQDIINPVTESETREQIASSLTREASFAPLENCVTHVRNELVDSAAARVYRDQRSRHWYPSHSFSIQPSCYPQIQEQKGFKHESGHQESSQKGIKDSETPNYPRCTAKGFYPCHPPLFPDSHVTTNGKSCVTSSRDRNCQPPSPNVRLNAHQNATNFYGILTACPSSVPHITTGHSPNKGDVNITRMYDLEHIQRLKCTVVNGRVYNVQNRPICAAPRGNGNPCRRNVSKSACNWHGDVNKLNSQNTKNGQLDGRGNLKGEQTIAFGFAKNLLSDIETVQISAPQAAKPQSQSRLRWNREEHFWFLLGYAKLGRKWSLISKIVQTRTTLQVQSHAQKYFNRRSNDNKKKSSIHDLTLESEEMQSVDAKISTEAKKARLSLAQF